jgi:hypothetical protein
VFRRAVDRCRYTRRTRRAIGHEGPSAQIAVRNNRTTRAQSTGKLEAPLARASGLTTIDEIRRRERLKAREPTPSAPRRKWGNPIIAAAGAPRSPRRLLGNDGRRAAAWEEHRHASVPPASHLLLEPQRFETVALSIIKPRLLLFRRRRCTATVSTGSLLFFFLIGYHHDERHYFSIRAAETRRSDSGDAPTDPKQSREARRQTE